MSKDFFPSAFKLKVRKPYHRKNPLIADRKVREGGFLAADDKEKPLALQKSP